MSFDPRAPRWELETRERVPTRIMPNFRDVGEMVDGPLLRIIASVQRRDGVCHASARGLRKMIGRDTGRMPGVGTVEAALERLEREGLVWQAWLAKGQHMLHRRGAELCKRGTRVTCVPFGQQRGEFSREALRRRAQTRDRRAPIVNRSASTSSAVTKELHRLFEVGRRPAGMTDDREREYLEKLAWSRREGARLAREEAEARGPPE